MPWPRSAKLRKSRRRRRSRDRQAMSVATSVRQDRQATRRSHDGGAARGERQRQGHCRRCSRCWATGRAHRGAACGAAVAAGAASFQRVAFESCRGDYIATLRKVADRSGSGAASARARHPDARQGRLRAEEAAGRPEGSRRRRWFRPRRRCSFSATTSTPTPIRRRAPSSRSRRTTTQSARRCGFSRPTPRRRRSSRRCCATRRSCATNRQIAASALHALDPGQAAGSKRARSCSTSRTMTTSRPPA